MLTNKKKKKVFTDSNEWKVKNGESWETKLTLINQKLSLFVRSSVAVLSCAFATQRSTKVYISKVLF